MKKAVKIILSVLSLIAIAVSCFLGVTYLKIKTAVLPDGFTVTAHTGCEETEENSLESIRKGYESGADTVEFDLAFSSDGKAVLSHNDEPQANCVALDEAFALITELPDIKVNIDCKSVADLKEVANLAKEYGISDRIFYTGIKEEDVVAVKKQTPEVAYWLNFDVDTEKSTDEEYLLSIAEKTRELGAVGLNINHKSCTKELIEVFHREELLVSIWTVNETKDMIKVIGFGADNITSRHPSQLAKIIELNKR